MSCISQPGYGNGLPFRSRIVRTCPTRSAEAADVSSCKDQIGPRILGSRRGGVVHADVGLSEEGH